MAQASSQWPPSPLPTWCVMSGCQPTTPCQLPVCSLPGRKVSVVAFSSWTLRPVGPPLVLPYLMAILSVATGLMAFDNSAKPYCVTPENGPLHIRLP